MNYKIELDLSKRDLEVLIMALMNYKKSKVAGIIVDKLLYQKIKQDKHLTKPKTSDTIKT